MNDFVGFKLVSFPKGYKKGPPNYYFRGFIPSYTHLQPWLNRVCWGYNYLITRGAPSCNNEKDSTIHHFKGTFGEDFGDVRA